MAINDKPDTVFPSLPSPVTGDADFDSSELTPAQRAEKAAWRQLRFQADQKASADLAAFLMALFMGVQDEKPGEEDALSEKPEFIVGLSGALNLDSQQLAETMRQVRSGQTSAHEAVRRTQASRDLSAPVDMAGAERIVSKFAAKGHPLLELIVSGESGGNYNIAYNGTAKGLQGNFTKMTVDQVLDWQKKHVQSGFASSAVGKYQIIQDTLASLKTEFAKKGENIGEKLLDEAMQERLGQALLERRGYKQFVAGKIDEKTFMANLAKEWASLPKDMGGQSHYAGDGLNKAHINPAVLLVAMRASKNENYLSDLQQQFAKGGVEQKQSPGNLTPAFKPGGTDEAAARAEALAAISRAKTGPAATTVDPAVVKPA